MAEILLSSEAFIKSVSSISDNLAGKYIRPSLLEAQEIDLKGILGPSLLAKLKSLVADKTISNSENAAYKTLLDECQYLLAYTTIVYITNRVSYKIGNFGVSKSQDENLQVATWDEIIKQQSFYQAKADSCCLALQTFILENRGDYPELTENVCSRISANLRSAASCGIFLGGTRNRRRYPR